MRIAQCKLIARCRFVACLALCTLQFAFCICVLHAETIDRVLAVVNGSVITLSDVTAARDLGIVSAGNAADPVRAILSSLIDRTLELSEVDRYAPPEPTADALAREVESVRTRFPTAAAFAAALARSGMDLPRLREVLRDDLRIRAYLDQRFVATADRRQQLVADWLAGLHRRAELTDLLGP